MGYFKALPTVELSSLLVGRDEDGRTLLHTAAAQGYMELLELLISAGSAKVLNKHDDGVGHVVVVFMHVQGMHATCTACVPAGLKCVRRGCGGEDCSLTAVSAPVPAANGCSCIPALPCSSCHFSWQSMKQLADCQHRYQQSLSFL